MPQGTPRDPRRGPVPPPRLTWRLSEVAEALGVSVSTVSRWAAGGRLRSVRIRGVVLIKPADLEAFLDEHREGHGVVPRAARSTRTGGERLS
jgi:excisionase family DNA binding protein